MNLRRITRGQWIWTGLVVLAVAIRIAVALPLVHDWDGYVFSQTAHDMLQGTTPYETAEENGPDLYPDSDRNMTAQWYAYPPLPLLLFTTPLALTTAIGIDLSPVAENLALKSLFIIGDIVCAYLVWRFLSANKKLAKRAALLVLFNPLLIWISSAWGMFDIWILNFLLLCLMAIRVNKPAWAGVFFALALQIKLFPLFFLPAIFVYAFQRFVKTPARIRMVAGFVLTTLLISLPFFLASPRGFLNQNLLMHFQRPPQGIGLAGMADYVMHVYNADAQHIVAVLSILGLLLIILFNLYSLVFLKGRENRLLVVILLIYSSTLALNKVVNEQYFVIFVCLLIILTHLGKNQITGYSRRALVRIETFATVSVLFASVVLGFHFMTFIHTSIATDTLGSPTQQAVYFLSGLFPGLPLHTYPNSLFTYYNFPVIVTYILLAPLIASLLWVVWRGLREAFSKRMAILRAVSELIQGYWKPSLIGGALIGLVMLPAGIALHRVNAFTPIGLLDTAAEFPKNPKVGTFYNVWWNNASHLPDVPEGAWSKTTQTPADGYYTSKNSYYAKHIRQMKESGIDFAAVSYHLYDRERYLTFGEMAEEIGFYTAPLIEPGDALNEREFHPTQPEGSDRFFQFAINDGSRDVFADTIISSLIDSKDRKSTLRIDGKPVVYLYDAHWFYPGFDRQSKEELAEVLVDGYRAKGQGYPDIAEAWGVQVAGIDDVVANYPADIKSFSFDTAIAEDYRTAFHAQYARYWKEIRAKVENKVGPVYLISTYAAKSFPRENYIIEDGDLPALGVFDAEFFYSISNTWSHWRHLATTEQIMEVWAQQVKNQAERGRAAGWPVFATVMPGYNDLKVRTSLGFEIPDNLHGNTYDWAWQTALSQNPDYVMIASWNEFFEGSAIEPTKETGTTRLDATRRWTANFKR